MQPIVWCMIGLPGSGKSFLLQKFKQELNKLYPKLKILLQLEPDHMFENFVHENKNYKLFQLLDDDPRSYASDIQNLIFTLLETQLRSVDIRQNDFDLILLDRDVRSCRCFSKNLHAEGHLTDLALAGLDLRTENLLASLTLKTEYLFLQTPIHICLERLKTRSRQGEISYTDEPFLKKLTIYHNATFPDKISITSLENMLRMFHTRLQNRHFYK